MCDSITTVFLLSYVAVLGNVFGGWEVPSTRSSSYWESEYWLDMPPSTAYAVTALQLLAAAGYVVYMVNHWTR